MTVRLVEQPQEAHLQLAGVGIGTQCAIESSASELRFSMGGEVLVDDVVVARIGDTFQQGEGVFQSCWCDEIQIICTGPSFSFSNPKYFFF